MHSMILQCACPFLGHRKTHIDVSRYALRNSRNEQPVWGCFVAEANAAQANKAIEEPFLVDSLNLLEHSGWWQASSRHSYKCANIRKSSSTCFNFELARLFSVSVRCVYPAYVWSVCVWPLQRHFRLPNTKSHSKGCPQRERDASKEPMKLERLPKIKKAITKKIAIRMLTAQPAIK